MMTLAPFLPAPPAALRSPSSSHRATSIDHAVTAAVSSPESLRRQIVASAHTVVVKVGTRVLTNPEGTLNYLRIEQLAEEIHAISTGGRRVVLVSSGAVEAGVSLLG